jgi:hypothetical protein
VKQKIDGGFHYWIIETKGQVHDGVVQKDAAIVNWCKEVSSIGDHQWGYMRVDQDWWTRQDLKSFATLVQGVKKNQETLGLSNLFFAP